MEAAGGATGSEAIGLLVSSVITTTLTFVAVIGDERQLDVQRLQRAWPPASRAAAIIAFSVFALPVHFIKTRGGAGGLRGALGYALGFVLGVAAICDVAITSSLALWAIAWAIERLFGLSLPD